MEKRNKKGLVVGQRVKHAVFGLGTVKEIDVESGTITTQFDNMESCRSFSSSAVLEVVEGAAT